MEIKIKINHYSKQTGEYLSNGVARPSPLDDNFLIPAQATKIKPPAKQKGFARCFKDGKWVQVIDNRHNIKYIGEDKVIFNLGDEVTPDMTSEKKQPILSQAQFIVSTRIRYDKAIQDVCIKNLLNDINSARNLATLTESPLQPIAKKITDWELAQQITFITLLKNTENGIITIENSTFDDNFIKFTE